MIPYKESLIDIIRAVVQDMSFPVTIKSVSNSGNIYTITTCDIYHAQPEFELIIGGQKYVIKEITAPDTIKVEGLSPIVVTTFDVYEPFFFHGTPIQQGVELIQDKKADNKTPMIWLYEQFTETFFKENLLA